MSRLVGAAACAAVVALFASPCLAFEFDKTQTNPDNSPALANPNSFSSTTTDAFGQQQTTSRFGNATVTVTTGSSPYSSSYYGAGQGYGGYSPYATPRGYLGPNDPRAGNSSSVVSPYNRFDQAWPFGFGR